MWNVKMCFDNRCTASSTYSFVGSFVNSTNAKYIYTYIYKVISMYLTKWSKILRWNSFSKCKWWLNGFDWYLLISNMF